MTLQSTINPYNFWIRRKFEFVMPAEEKNSAVHIELDHYANERYFGSITYERDGHIIDSLSTSYVIIHQNTLNKLLDMEAIPEYEFWRGEGFSLSAFSHFYADFVLKDSSKITPVSLHRHYV